MHNDSMKVYFGRNFWGRHGRDILCEKVAVNRRFEWAGNTWYIPAVYVCEQGIVIDYCVETEPEKIKAFVDRYAALEERADELSHEDYEQAMQDNPMNIKFGTEVMVNDEELLRSMQGCGISWLPETCNPVGQENVPEALELVEFYKLDKNKGWTIRRHSHKWTAVKMPVLNRLEIKLSKPKIEIEGIRFKTPLPGESIKFTHPITGAEHVLNVVNVEHQESTFDFGQEGYEFPKHSTCMMYTLAPDIDNADFRICDTKKSESPYLKVTKSKSEHGAASIGIIGGADGPTAIIMQPVNKDTKLHMACSAVTFEPADEVEWRVVFRHAACEDIVVELI